LGCCSEDTSVYGYLSEHHSFGEVAKKAGEYAEDLAATMLATTLGHRIDINIAWDERKQIYKASGHIFRPLISARSAEGNKDGLWTTVFAGPQYSLNNKNDNVLIITIALSILVLFMIISDLSDFAM